MSHEPRQESTETGPGRSKAPEAVPTLEGLRDAILAAVGGSPDWAVDVAPVMALLRPPSPTDPGAREALVEQLAEAMRPAIASVYDRHDHTRPLNHVNHVEWIEAVLPVVAAQVEAAVSVVRAERDEARREADVEAENHDAAIARAEAAETERDKARRDAEHWRTEANNGLDDQIASSDALLEMITHRESAESERDALREKVARVEALRGDAQYKAETYRNCDHTYDLHARLWGDVADQLDRALSDPTTPDQKGGAS